MADMRERLIELIAESRQLCANAILEHCQEKCKYYDLDDCCENLFADYLIENGVTIVEHGKWEVFGKRGEQGYMYACSECSAKYDGQTPYCPNCGAKMEV